jgi:parallel beta-helix repeat protein
MPHCFKLARRLSSLPSWRRRAASVLCVAMLAVACSEEDTLAPTGQDTALDTPLQPLEDSTVTNDSLVDGVDPVMAAATTGNTLYPGQDIAAKVNNAPTGTTFTFTPGVYRMVSLSPKAGMTFVGQAGAILNGARLLTTFTRQNGYWVASGQTQQGERRGDGKCLPDSPRCAYPEQLFIDGQMLKHVGSLAGVSAGKWYFDYGADKIYFANDPTGKKVETSVTRSAFSSGSSGVTIRGLIIEKYASPAQVGAIGGSGGVPRWTLQSNEVRWNHGTGIRTGPAMQILSNNVHHNGQMGIAGSGDNMLVSGNELSYNNVAGFSTGWEAGATKFSRTDGLIVRGNFSHHNHGAGLWTDIENINSLYENNRVEDNDWRGIHHEISYKVIIRNNIIRRNGFRNPNPKAFPIDGAGIVINSSPNVEIYGNTIEGNKNGIGAIETGRGSGKYGALRLSNMYVHDNSVVQPSGQAAGVMQSVGSNLVYTSWNNRFVHNTYDLGANTKYFRWMNGDRSTPEWKGYGLDVTGLFK